MNNFKIKLTKDEETGKVIGPNAVYMKLSPEMERDEAGATLRAHFEINILRGTRTPAADGSCEYWFEVTEEEGMMFIQALTLAHFMPAQN